MVGELARKLPEPAAGGGGVDYMEILKTMDREEILEVLSEGFCQHCCALLESRIHNFINKKFKKMPLSNGGSKMLKEFQPANDNSESLSPGQESPPSSSNQMLEHVYSERKKRDSINSSSASANSHQNLIDHFGSEILLNDGLVDVSSMTDNGLSEEQKEQIRFSKVGKKKDFVCIERVNGKSTNILQGLELHTKVFNAEEQKKIVECVYNLQRMGQKRQLRARTYSEPKKWMRGKGRVTIQFGCCYNYAVDKDGNPPGIVRDEEVDPLPSIFKKMIKRMVRWHVLPPTCIPNSCIVNIYDEGDCIPPHIDHHDFLRPFCTVSFLTECNIVFGSNLKIVSPGEFSGSVSIPLPVGSVLILNGHGADVAKHCVPGVPAKRISITFRKMDDSKLPYRFSLDPELSGIKPLLHSPSVKSPYQESHKPNPLGYHSISKSPVQQKHHQNGKPTANKPEVSNSMDTPFAIDRGDFPPLGSSSSLKQSRNNRAAALKH
ncbi:hypothetical protein JCGZ_05032 [Jatropha curcas]|uniref:Fe2OG dioxygenase domain-containing protein n=1 Tax=Jatropha curcas TaxID=180498 RepID=A0A067L300_JATCU|nr:RNA demethylase ALKBH9B [Jatropha curcas]KDP38875.1 hypothetical protein JCGZ_05032 [Jatropha curcas]